MLWNVVYKNSVLNKPMGLMNCDSIEQAIQNVIEDETNMGNSVSDKEISEYNGVLGASLTFKNFDDCHNEVIIEIKPVNKNLFDSLIDEFSSNTRPAEEIFNDLLELVS